MSCEQESFKFLHYYTTTPELLALHSLKWSLPYLFCHHLNQDG